MRTVKGKEDLFFDRLRDIFVGAKVEGKSGFVNLMRMKAKYYERGILPVLREDIERHLQPFPEFREELFDRLHDFFHRYFSESGSIYFRFTPPHDHVYERVYTNDMDVVLFWKTHMLYYVKSDRLFQKMLVDVDGFRFYFDTSKLEHKQANEKRSLVYYFKGWKAKNAMTFSVAYSERGRQTSIKRIQEAIRSSSGARRRTPNVPSEETLQRAFRIFERQNEVDYFINKDAGRFLREQLGLWLYGYVFEEDQLGTSQRLPCASRHGGYGHVFEEDRRGTVWTEKRVRQLQVLKQIASNVIDFIAQFEDELKRIWEKPKFVLESHYVLTLSRIAGRDGGMDVLKRLVRHSGMRHQVKEWRELKMVDDAFRPGRLLMPDRAGKRLDDRYQHLPIDTAHFPDLEMAIVSLFDHLDQELDGWLVHSENYQALNTMGKKFQGKVKCIYADPPFNLGENADYDYAVNYKDSVWLTLLENRFALARDYLARDGSFFCRVGHDGNMLLRLLLNQIFGPENYRNEIIVRRAEEEKGELVKQFESMKSMMVNYDNLYWYSVDPGARFPHIRKRADKKAQWHSFWKAEDRPQLRYELLGETPKSGQWMWSKNRAIQAVRNYEAYLKDRMNGESLEAYWNRTGRKLEFVRKEEKTIQYWIPPRDEVVADNNWLDIRGYSNQWGFKTENSEALLHRIVKNLTKSRDIVMDFFLGSGTTIAVSHKLGRKWIGVEMGQQIRKVVLPRMKQVLFGEQSGISTDAGWHGGGFFKYFRLEQYEEVLRRARYKDDEDPQFVQDPYTQYVFLRDTKMLDNNETDRRAMKVDMKSRKILVDLSKLYQGIDLAETISCLTGKWIKRIHPAQGDSTRQGKVEFEDGSVEDMQNLAWELVKPLVWW